MGLKEEELIDLYKKTKEEKYFEQICDIYKNNIYHRILSLDISNKDDLIQEAYIILFNCVNNYEKGKGKFYSYFTISFNREVYKSLHNDYYIKAPKVLERLVKDEQIPLILKLTINEFRTDSIGKLIVDECIYGNMSIRELSKRTGISYNTLYYRYTYIISSLKKHID